MGFAHDNSSGQLINDMFAWSLDLRHCIIPSLRFIVMDQLIGRIDRVESGSDRLQHQPGRGLFFQSVAYMKGPLSSRCTSSI